MPCYSPRGCYQRKDGSIHRCGINSSNAELFKVPCGECIGCKLDYGLMWSIRSVHEASLHSQNCFATLTYNNQNYPKNGSLDKSHMSEFMRMLRKKIYPRKVRFYGSGEYGDKLGRPHLHMLLFGYSPADKVLHKNGQKRRGRAGVQDSLKFSTYTSKELESVWRKGFVTVGDVTQESAAYVARYVAKKITGEKAKEHYKGKEPEFALMSRRPGIGYDWYKKYKADMYPKGFVTHKGKKIKLPRYYDKMYMRECADKNEEFGTWEDYEELKRNRKENIKEETDKRLRQKEIHKGLITKQLIRTYERNLT